MDKQLFKLRDRVFDVLYGWGVVNSIEESSTFPIRVHFDNLKQCSYTWDGKITQDYNPTLSFTEYTLEGFSQEKQIKFPCTGMFGGIKFGICVGRFNQGRFICEQEIQWESFQPMTFEEYCKIKNIKL